MVEFTQDAGSDAFASTAGEVVQACIFRQGDLGCTEARSRYIDGPMPFVEPFIPVVVIVLLVLFVRNLVRIMNLISFIFSRNRPGMIALSAATWAPLAVILGYIVYVLPMGAAGAISFSSWLAHPLRNGVGQWLIFGAVIGAAAGYMRWERPTIDQDRLQVMRAPE